MKNQNEIQDFDGGWHRQVTKEHICIWTDKWMENHKKNLEREKQAEVKKNGKN